MSIKIPREQTMFATPVGLLSFLHLFPGQAVDSQQPGSKSYKCELGVRVADLPSTHQMVQAVTTIAKAYDPDNWQRHVFGPSGRFATIDQKEKRDASKYSYYAGMYVLGFSQVLSLKSLKMEGARLDDPAVRQKYDMAVAAAAPGAFRFPNLNDPADIAKIDEINRDRMARSLKPYTESEYHKAMIPVMSHEIWPGCWGRISGRAYWSSNSKPQTVLLALEHVLLVAPGERLVGERSPDSAFSAFAPAAELAPQAPPPPPGGLVGGDPWDSLR